MTSSFPAAGLALQEYGRLPDGTPVQQATLSDGSSVKIGNTTMTIRFVPHDTGGDSV